MSGLTPEAIRVIVEAAIMQNEACTLLNLPTELLIDILGYIVKIIKRNGDPVVLDVRHYHTIRPRYSAVSYTCKQLRKEVLPLFFGLNNFRFVSETAETLQGGSRHEGGFHNHKRTARQTIDTDINSRVVAFGFAPPAGSQYPCVANPSYVHNLPHITGNYIELPGISLRPMLKQLELVLNVPKNNRNARLFGPTYTDTTRDWLFPVRAITRLGFTHLKELKIVVKYHPSRIDTSSVGAGQSLEDWLDEKLIMIDVERFAESVSWIYQAI
ncbi:hypothetical protein LTR10_014999 [Elasticomyces elasticus]|nr:hypothetical protein LTR10_014999 [Elasticomyces elasticus]KAK4964576.1 hypothetical protein LTR42_012873 [Elasticomyces elasticus]